MTSRVASLLILAAAAWLGVLLVEFHATAASTAPSAPLDSQQLLQDMQTHLTIAQSDANALAAQWAATAPSTLPTVTFANYAATTSPSSPWPATSPSNPNGAWFTATLGPAPDTRQVIRLASGQAIAALADNTELVLSGTYNVNATVVLSGNQQFIHTDPAATQPAILNWTGPANGTILQCQGAGTILQNLRFQISNPNASAAQAILVGDATNLVIDGCSSGPNGPASFINAGSLGTGPMGCLIHNCSTSGIGAYSVFTAGSGIVIDGCTFTNSHAEHLIRGTGANVTIENCTLANLQSVGAAASKDAISPQGGDFWSIVNCTVGAGGPITFGPILTAQAVNPPLVTHAQIRNCTLSVPINIGPGCTGVCIHGNAITTSPYAINLNGPVSNFPNLSISNVSIDSNQIVNNGANGASIKFFNGWTQSSGIQATVTNNTYTETGVQIGPSNYFSAALIALCPDLSQISFSGNVWGMPAGFDYHLPQATPFHPFCVGGTVGPANYVPLPSGDQTK